jgi:RHS repeat-associated protein
LLTKFTVLQPAKIAGEKSNRLSSTEVRRRLPNSTITYSYKYDVHGNITRMPHLENHPDPEEANMHWDFRDQLNQVDLGGGGTAYYLYDMSGQRIRKVWEKSTNLIEERIYFGGLEIFRRRNGIDEVTLERQTLHIFDNKHRIALVESRAVGDDSASLQLIRYQFGNHLGSANLELDDQAQVISYEEYTPYGSTSYQAVSSQTETPKRYRYTNKERDQEGGLYYHGVRYYMSWLARWASCDPMGIDDNLNTYTYVKDLPSILMDSTGAYGELSPLSAGGITTTTHEELKTEASKYTASKMQFGFTDVFKCKTDPEYLMKFKAQFVYENRDVIKAAAQKYDLPPELVAGVVFVEIGGKDPIKPAVYWARSWIPFTDDKDKTSRGQQAIQVRRAAESLGYDPKKLTGAQRKEILKSLDDPSQSIFIAAKHLNDLRNIDNPGKAGKDLGTEDIKVIGARYNQGPDKSLADVKKDLSYGESIIKRWSELDRLLATAPPKLEYSPAQNNIVKLVENWFGQAEWEIGRLYGVP